MKINLDNSISNSVVISNHLEPSAPKINLNDFINKSRSLRKRLGSAAYIPTVTNLSHKTYISESQENMNAISAAFKRNSSTLLIAATGKGKTFTIDAVFKRHRDTVNILTTPCRVQNLQNETEYNMHAIIGNGSRLEEIDLDDGKDFTVVYDKIDAFETLLNGKKKINLCIDEAHLLVEACNYRAKAISNLVNFAEKVIAHGGSVVYMSATPEPLIYIQFDHILQFSDANYSAPANVMEIYKFPATEFMQNTICIIKNLIADGYIPFVLLQDKTMIDRMRAILDRDGYPSLSLDSSDKGYSYEQDSNSADINARKIKYNNKMYHGIITESQLPGTDKDGRDVKAYFSTSVIEVGTNINGIDNFKNPKLMPIYICHNDRQMKFSSMEQFCNRVRYKVDKYAIFIRNVETEKHRDIVTAEYIMAKKYEIVQENLAHFNDLNNLAHTSFDIDNANAIINGMLNTKTIHGDSSDLGCIYYNETERRVEYDITALWQISYTEYQKQYYYEQSQFAIKLSSIFRIPTKTIMVPEMDNTPDDPETKRRIKDTLNNISGSFVLQSAFRNNQFTTVEMKVLRASDIYQQVRKLVNCGASISAACKIVANAESEKEVNYIMKRYEKESFIGLEKDSDIIKSVIRGDIMVTNLKADVKKQIENLKKTPYWDDMQRAIKLDVDFDRFVRFVISNDCKNHQDSKRYLYECTLCKLNALHLSQANHDISSINKSWGVAGREHFILVEIFEKYNANGNFYQTRITKELLIETANILTTKMRGYTLRTRMYNKTTVKHMLEACFYTKVDHEFFLITGLRLHKNKNVFTDAPLIADFNANADIA